MSIDLNVDQCTEDDTIFANNKESLNEFRNGKKYIELTAADMVGQKFESLDEASKFYSAYSKILGFGVRKAQVKRDTNGDIRKRVWVCDKEGYRREEWLHKSNRKRDPRPLTRQGCGAAFCVNKDKMKGKWTITKFVPDHSHQLFATVVVPFIRLNRCVSKRNIEQEKAMHNVGTGTSKIMDYMVNEAGGYDKVGFTVKDLHNTLMAERKCDMLDTDSETVIAYLKTKTEMDPDLFCRYTVDSDNRLANIFWSDSTSQFDYTCFSDVLAFDATYKTNAYGKPLVILVGVNNHHRTTIFGMTLLVDETVDTYTWVLKTFLLAVNNKQPQSVVTDGDKAMRKSIKNVLPKSYHRLCTWHIERNAQSNLHDAQVVRTFTNCMVSECTPEEFEHLWLRMVDKYSLHNKEWLTMMYETREMWAEALMKGKFFAGMRSTQRCESMNAYLNKHVQSRLKLYEFMISIDRAISRMRNREVIDEVKCKNSTPVMLSHLQQIEGHAAHVYASRIFKIVQAQIKEEAVLIKTVSMAYEDKRIYTLTKFKHSELKWTVVYYWGQPHIQCSCNIFNSIGIPCSHSFYVMKDEHIGEIPDSMILKHWRKDARSNRVKAASIRALSDDVATSLRYGSLSVECNKMCLFASKTEDGYKKAKIEVARLTSQMEEFWHVSKETKLTMGETAGKNVIKDPLVVKTKGGYAGQTNKEAKERRCSKCKMAGHTKRTCEIKLNTDNSDVCSKLHTDHIHVEEHDNGMNFSQTTDFTNRAFMQSTENVNIDIDLTPPTYIDSQPNIDISLKSDSYGKWWWRGQGYV